MYVCVSPLDLVDSVELFDVLVYKGWRCSVDVMVTISVNCIIKGKSRHTIQLYSHVPSTYLDLLVQDKQ